MQHVILLRAIANVHMAPYRAKLEALGFEDVESFGATGYFLVGATGPAAKLEDRVTKAVGSEAIIRSDRRSCGSRRRTRTRATATARSRS